ncbi:MAG: hypothetical protein WC712_08290, partial [Candidatus Brocadiia bacterium]
YVEVQGVPPTEFASLLAKLPKRKIVVRCGEGCFPSLPDAFSPLDPLGLLVENADYRDPVDFQLFTSCVFLDVTLSRPVELRLPPRLKSLHLDTTSGSFYRVLGAEGTLEALRLTGVTKFSGWMENYSALTDVTLTSSLSNGNSYLDFTKTIVQLPALLSLRFEPGIYDTSFLSSLKGLKALSLKYSSLNIATISGLTRLEFLQIWHPCNFDGSMLSTLSSLRYLDLVIYQPDSWKKDKPDDFDLAVLEPVAGRIFRLGFFDSIHILQPERMSALTSLEHLSFWGKPGSEVPIKFLPAMRNLTHLSGIHVLGQDLSALASLPHLECLVLNSDDASDLSGLKGCVALKVLEITGSKLGIEALGTLSSLSRLSLDSGSEVGNGADENSDFDCGPLSNLKRLRFLTLNAKGVRSAEFLRTLESLEGLELSNFGGTDLTFLEKSKSLRFLQLSRCPKLAAASIKLPRILRWLILDRCDVLENLTFLEGAEGLASLDVWNCNGVSALPTLSVPLIHLTELHIVECFGLKDTSGLASMPAIESLVIAYYLGTEIAGFDALTSLRKLLVWSLTLDHLPKAAPEAPLVDVSFLFQENPASLDGVETWRHVRKLELALGKKDLNLTPLIALTELDSLVLSGGNPETDISPLTKMTWLKTLDLRTCTFSTPENVALLKKALPGCLVLGR